MPTIRNPISSMAVTLVQSLGFGLIASALTLLIPFPAFELQLFYLGFAFFLIGVVAGRASIVGFLGFVGALLGTAFAAALWFSVLPGLVPFLPPSNVDLIWSLLLGLAGGAGGLITGKLGLRRVQEAANGVPGNRICDRCGSRVGLAARRCWSCRATLHT